MTTGAPPSRFVRWGSVLVTLMAALVGAELTARQFYRTSLRYDPLIGYVQAPGTVRWSTEARGTSTWNAQGLRRAVDPRPELPRVLVVGDSVTEALQVDDGTPYTDRLEAKLSDLQFLNAGRSTMSTADYVAFAPVWRARFQPVWTIVQVRENDFTNDAFGATDRPHFEIEPNGALKLVPFVRPPITRFDFRLRQHSMLVTLAYLRVTEYRATIQAAFQAPPSSAGSTPNYPVESIIDRLLEAYANRLTIALVASYDPKNPTQTNETEERMLTHCAMRGVSCVSSRDAYAAFHARGEAPFGFPTSGFNVGHLNARGHEAFADTLAKELERLGPVLTTAP